MIEKANLDTKKVSNEGQGVSQVMVALQGVKVAHCEAPRH